jgi:hypothetical protein
MTSQQDARIKELENELTKRGENEKIGWQQSNSPESSGFLFGEVNGVTVTVTPGGLINIPAVRTYHPPKYPTPVVAAACAARAVGKAEGEGRRRSAISEDSRDRTSRTDHWLRPEVSK